MFQNFCTSTLAEVDGKAKNEKKIEILSQSFNFSNIGECIIHPYNLNAIISFKH